MKKIWVGFGLGLLTGTLVTILLVRFTGSFQKPGYDANYKSEVCYSCFWQGYGPKFQAELIDFYQQYRNPDPLVMADARYILWRTSGMPNCNSLSDYKLVAQSDADPFRRWSAASILGFSAQECGEDGASWFKRAAQNANKVGLSSEAHLLGAIGSDSLKPNFADTTIETDLRVPPQAQVMILGASRIEVTGSTRLATQVERVARDWISYQLRWNLSGDNLTSPILNYHEGAMVAAIRNHLPALQVFPLTGTIVVRRDEKWYAPDETGTFRFEILNDKIQYPTTHAWKNTAWIEDTHGISALVPQVIERKMDLVIGCGDSEGKAKAAYYLSQKGVNVVFPGDRYQDLLLGYKGKGILMGGAPIHLADEKVIIGDQPIRFSLKERIIVEDTKMPFPIQYYDAGARYFRRLSQSVPLNLVFVDVPAENMLEMVLERARKEKSTAVAVRIATTSEDYLLRLWLDSSRSNRAILFHSGLYPYAQELFHDYRSQVTFGDLHPRFE